MYQIELHQDNIKFVVDLGLSYRKTKFNNFIILGPINQKDISTITELLDECKIVYNVRKVN